MNEYSLLLYGATREARTAFNIATPLLSKGSSKPGKTPAQRDHGKSIDALGRALTRGSRTVRRPDRDTGRTLDHSSATQQIVGASNLLGTTPARGCGPARFGRARSAIRRGL